MDLFDFEAKDILTVDRKTLRDEKTKAENLLDKLYDDRYEGKVSERFYQDKQPKYEEKIEDLQEQIEDIDAHLNNWNENIGLMIETVDSLRDFKSKWESLTPKVSDSKTTQADKKEKQRNMLRLITNRISTYAYLGPLHKVKRKGSKKPIVNKLRTRKINFEWNEEFELLFEMGVIKKYETKNVDNSTFPPFTGETKKPKGKKTICLLSNIFLTRYYPETYI